MLVQSIPFPASGVIGIPIGDFRINFTALVGGDSPDWIDVQEVELLDQDGANQVAGGVATASSTNPSSNPPGASPAGAFDGSIGPNSFWQASSGAMPQWLRLQLPQIRRIAAVAVTSPAPAPNGTIGEFPRDFQIQRMIDGVPETLRSVVGEAFDPAGLARIVYPLVSPIFTAPPAVSSPNGFTAVGDTLEADPGAADYLEDPASAAFAGNDFTYQWLRNGAAIAGETAFAYTLQAADEGAMIAVQVTAHNAIGDTPATSAAIGPIVTPALGPVDRVTGTGEQRVTGAGDVRAVMERVQ